MSRTECYRRRDGPGCGSGPSVSYVDRFVRNSTDSFTRYGPREFCLDTLCGRTGAAASGSESRGVGATSLCLCAPAPPSPTLPELQLVGGYLLDYRTGKVEAIAMSTDRRVIAYANARVLFFVRVGETSLYREQERGEAQIYLTALPETVEPRFQVLGLVNLAMM